MSALDCLGLLLALSHTSVSLMVLQLLFGMIIYPFPNIILMMDSNKGTRIV